MVIFKDLRVSPDGKTLLIGAAMPEYAFAENMYISGIEISVGSYSSSSRQSLYAQSDDTEERKEVWIDVAASDIEEDDATLTTFDNKLIFVYVTVDGVPTSDTPCSYDNCETIGVTYSKRLIYKKALAYVRKSISCGKAVSNDFVNYYLQWKQFDLALKTGNYTLAASLFEENLASDDDPIVKIGGCGCGN